MSVKTTSFRTNWLIHSGGAAVIMALSAVFVFACVTPRFKARSQRLEQRSELNDLKTNIQTTNSRVRSLELRLGSAMQTAGEETVRLTSPHQLNQRLEELTTLLNDCELTIDSITPEPPTRNERFNSVKILIEGVGTYPRYAWFLQRAHTQFPELAVAAFELNSRGDRDASVSFRLGMILYTAPATPNRLQEVSVDVGNAFQREGAR